MGSDDVADELNFIDWNWQSYSILRADPELKNQQERLLWETDLCEGKDGLEYSFIPTKTMKRLKNQLFTLYERIQVVNNTIILCNEIFNTSKIEWTKSTLLHTQQLHDFLVKV